MIPPQKSAPCEWILWVVQSLAICWEALKMQNTSLCMYVFCMDIPIEKLPHIFFLLYKQVFMYVHYEFGWKFLWLRNVSKVDEYSLHFITPFMFFERVYFSIGWLFKIRLHPGWLLKWSLRFIITVLKNIDLKKKTNHCTIDSFMKTTC